MTKFNSAQQLANERYKELCSQYGDLTYRIRQMQKDLAIVEKHMEEINAAVPHMVTVENSLTYNKVPDAAVLKSFHEADQDG